MRSVLLIFLVACASSPASQEREDLTATVTTTREALQAARDELDALTDRVEALEATKAKPAATTIATYTPEDCEASADGSIWIPAPLDETGMAPLVIERFTCEATDEAPATAGSFVLSSWTSEGGGGYAIRSCMRGCLVAFVSVNP